MNIYTKVCTKCKISKPVPSFNKDSRLKSGLRSDCKDCQKQYKNDNKELIAHKKKEWREKNKEFLSEYHHEWYINNIEEKRDYDKNYRKDNKTNINEYNKLYQKRKRKIDPLYNLISNIRSLISNSISSRGFSKNSKSAQILGCSFEDFKIHIENQFPEGMSWENRSDWHLDHIKPISLATTEEEIITLNHYTNFQPLWAIDNLRKGNRYSG